MDSTFALDGYVIDELIGFGGSGEVWRAHEVATGEIVALKRLRTRGATATERLRREAGLLATVAGPHVIGVRRMVVDGDEAVMVMDFAGGGSLAEVLRARGRLSAAEVVTVIAPIAAALAAAHARELIHGDITPANILFTADGRPLLADFGVARLLGTTPAQLEATLDYLDPAVGSGTPASSTSDIYALGAVAFTALAGRPLWGSAAPEVVAARAAAGERPPLAELAPAAPPALVVVVESMLAADPAVRPAAKTVSAAVMRASAAAPVQLVAAPVRQRPATTTQQVRRPALPPPARPNADPTRARPPTSVRSGARPPTSVRSGARPATSVRSGPARDRASTGSEWPVWRRRLVIAAAAVLALIGAVGVGVSLARVGHGSARVLTSRDVNEPVARSSTAASPIAPASPVVPVASPPWRAIVVRLDSLRAKAFTEADVAPLAQVYVPGVAAYSRDVATISSLASRGVRAKGFAATVSSVAVDSATATTARLRVVDRLSGYSLVNPAGDVVGQGAARPARAYTMQLALVHGAWRVNAIHPT